MLDVSFRDVKIKCRKLRNKGLTTGTLKTKNGEIIPISMVIYKVDAYLNENGFKPILQINFQGKILNTKIKYAQKHLTKHNVINIDLVEV